MSDVYKLRILVGELLKTIYNVDILNDPNFKETPERVAKMYSEMLSSEYGLQEKVDTILSKRFPADYNSIICTNWIEAHSMCPHHLLPVSYKIGLAYLPGKTTNTSQSYVIGASKLARLAVVLAKRAILQEQYAQDIVNTLETALKPRGVACIVIGKHGCMASRGIKTNAPFKVSLLTGSFRTESQVRQEFFSLLNIGM